MARSTPDPDDPTKPWHHAGLRFTCTGCGDCCSGGAGYVWVNKEEVAAMAELAGLGIAEFEALRVRSVGVRRSLKERPGGDCVLLDATTRKCTLYDARPRQCRTWPFWDSTVKSPQAWTATCEACPGAGVGKLYSLESIEAERAVIRI
ncbi:MAG: YkgJ family cysteine cluster protein [Lacipirellulaceae bacterium]